MLRTIIYFHAYIILDFPITYRNASLLCQSECTCLHKTVNILDLLKVMKIPTQKVESTLANVKEKSRFKKV